jgi:hypothetical protein
LNWDIFSNDLFGMLGGVPVPTAWRVLGLRMEELHNEELRDLYSLPSIIRIIKLRRMRWAVHVARMGEKRNAYRLMVGSDH